MRSDSARLFPLQEKKDLGDCARKLSYCHPEESRSDRDDEGSRQFVALTVDLRLSTTRLSRRGTEAVITGAPRKRLACQKRARGFESHPLRHPTLKLRVAGHPELERRVSPEASA